MGRKSFSYRFGEFTLDSVRGCVLRAGIEVKLRPKVYEALRYLVERPGQLIEKNELMQAIWPDTAVTDDSLVQCVLELRRALGDREQELFKTVPRRGYVFTAPVTRADTASRTDMIGDALDLLGRTGARTENVEARRDEIPTPRNNLIGREQQVENIANLLARDSVRLLSLTGPGGAGKTRLAIAVAKTMADQAVRGAKYGVRVVSLASITQPDLVATALADAFRVKQAGSRSIPQLISDQLHNAGPFLLVLDNFEQVLSAAALVAEMLEACSSLKILVTSRSALHIYGEQEFPVTPLAQGFAVELFTQRAAAVWPDFAVGPENEAVIHEICRRLDGLPLAIELAAARTKVLSPTAILGRLESRLQLLTGGATDLPARHQTLRKTIDWSHGLLSDAESVLFRRLSVFAGGFTLESAEAVCNTARDLEADLFDGLSSLVDKNLVQFVNRSGDEPRFAMLETIREYATERLADSGEQKATQRAHAAYCLILAEEGNPELNPAERAHWLTQCDTEIVNFRVALDWLYQTKEIEWALRLCSALFRFWDMREHLIEGRTHLEMVLKLAGDDHTSERARISQFLGALTTAQGDFMAAERSLLESLALYEELQDRTGVAASLNALGISARDRGDYRTAEDYVERSLTCWRMLADRLATARCLHNLANVAKARGNYVRALSALKEAADIFDELGEPTGSAWSFNQQGDIAYAQGDLAAARSLYEQALSIFRGAGDQWGAARSLTDLTYLDCAEGKYQAAHAACCEALRMFGQLGHRRGIARALEGFAFLAVSQGKAARALRLAAAAFRLRQSVHAPLHGAEQSQLNDALISCWNLLSVTDGKRAWTEGLEMSLERAIESALAKHQA